jgi:hypothetical protein
MAKSLTDLIKSKANTVPTPTQQSAVPTNLPEYVGSNTENLYVIGHKNGVPVKIKVRANSCCDGIDLGGGGGSSPDEPIIQGGIKKGASFASFNALYAAYKAEQLETDTIYDVSDKGTIEQYVYTIDENGNKAIHQISGNFNMIVSDPGSGRSVCTLELNNGALHYNLPELVVGDYLFKGWTEMTSFVSDTLSLVSAKEMFRNTSLRTFCGELSSLESADHMFGHGVKLDYDSVLNIVDSIKDVKDIAGTHNIEIGYNSADTQLVEELHTLQSELNAKGWNVSWLKDGI